MRKREVRRRTRKTRRRGKRRRKSNFDCIDDDD